MSKLNSGEVFGIDSIAPLEHTVPDPDNPSGSEYIGPDGVRYAVYTPPSSPPL